MFQWRELLTKWSQSLVVSNAGRKDLPSDVLASGWLGYAGATEEQLARAETRLNVSLPPSYREFLKVSNGWRRTTLFIDRLWPAEEIEWFPVRNQNLIDVTKKAVHAPVEISDEDYFVYGEGQDPCSVREEYLETALEISPWGDAAIYLLNPKVVNREGEWEAWMYATWLAGAKRYRSFWELMQGEYRSFLRLKDS